MEPPLAVALALFATVLVALAGFVGFRLGGNAAQTAKRMPRAQPTEDQRTRLRDKLLDLDEITVDDIMIPRNEIASIDVSDDWDSILDTLRATPHTRLPVCRDNIDNIIGVLHMKKVAHALARGDFTRERLLELASEREGYFAPEGTSLSAQLLNFQRDRRRIALVVDEYGDIRGLVTLEDILEEIVGDFTSAPGAFHKDFHRDSDGSFVVTGSVNVRVLNRALGWNLPADGPRTFNGLILESLETIPKPGANLVLGDLLIEILQTADNTVRTARVRVLETQDELPRSKGVA